MIVKGIQIFYLSNSLASIDAIIETLSMPNDPLKLQNVAKELLYLQKVVNGTINSQRYEYK